MINVNVKAVVAAFNQKAQEEVVVFVWTFVWSSNRHPLCSSHDAGGNQLFPPSSSRVPHIASCILFIVETWAWFVSVSECWRAAPHIALHNLKYKVDKNLRSFLPQIINIPNFLATAECHHNKMINEFRNINLNPNVRMLQFFSPDIAPKLLNTV